MSSPRRSPALKPISAPLSSTPLPRLIYILITLSVLLISYYSYRHTPSSWFDMALGKIGTINDHGAAQETFESASSSSVKCVDESVEDRINGLARVLGIPSKELASVVADVVRRYVPPDRALLKNENGNERVVEEDSTVQKVVGSLAPGFEEDELDS